MRIEGFTVDCPECGHEDVDVPSFDPRYDVDEPVQCPECLTYLKVDFSMDMHCSVSVWNED